MFVATKHDACPTCRCTEPLEACLSTDGDPAPEAQDETTRKIAQLGSLLAAAYGGPLDWDRVLKDHAAEEARRRIAVLEQELERLRGLEEDFLRLKTAIALADPGLTESDPSAEMLLASLGRLADRERGL